MHNQSTPSLEDEERPLAVHHPSSPLRPLSPSGRWVLRAPPGSFSAEAALRRSASASALLSDLEERLSAAARRPGPEEADLTELTTAAGGDPAVQQEVGRIGLQRLHTVQAVGNQTSLSLTSPDSNQKLEEILVPGCIPAVVKTCDRNNTERTLTGECNHVEV
ncbi:uncharacterized protein LOC122393363 [Amphibalanus amphitrite]|uniref:uncharacterized protein LOC122393363 n=1 Tax=Amphibalanus amphitrite TaxID=1232801 RepID=UPI001C9197AC|nr:uncharacterized protein LOC122393363 [Amphibalanus amphitrite]